MRKENEINLDSDTQIMLLRVGETCQVETRYKGARTAFKSQVYRKKDKLGLGIGEVYFMCGTRRVYVREVSRLVRLQQVF